MISIKVFVVSMLLCSFAVCSTIISLDTYYDSSIDSSMENDMSIDKIYSLDGVSMSNILDTMYVRQSLGKSHRFYFTQGERKEGDKLLGQLVKQTGWKAKSDVNVNVTYPANGKNESQKLTFVMLIVYQESDINRIHVSNGGIDDTKMTISIYANQTRYLRYDASFYGL